MTIIEIENILKPINDLEKSIISDTRFQTGLNYGKPRPGHPEGKIINHIKEVLLNVEKFEPDKVIREKLRLIALIHDTFKFQVDRNLPLVGENHHGFKAMKFAQDYISDLEILSIIELHDEAYNAVKKYIRNRNNYRVLQLIEKIKNYSYLYLKFYECDEFTGDKEHECYFIFKEFLENASD